MPFFKYKALTPKGQTIEDRVEASDRFAIYKKIKEEGNTVVFVTEESTSKSKLVTSLESLFSKVNTQEKIIFARNLGAMIEAGLSMTRALSVMEKQTKNKKLKSVLGTILDNVSKGKSLADSLKDFKDIFPPLFISMVKAGEESGNLANSLKIVALQMDKSHALVKKIRGALIYPAVIVSLMIVIGVLMMIYMVPTLTETFQGLGVDLPLSTRIIINISEFLRHNILITLISVIALVAALFVFVKTKTGINFFHKFVLKLPIVGNITKEVNSARTARTLSSLLSAGVDIVAALTVTEEVIQNIYFKKIINKAQISVEKGDPISGVFIANEKLYPIFVGEMMNVGEETGRMAEMLLNVATYYEDEVDQKTKDMSTIIEPVLMILIGIAVGIFAISMLAPTYSLVEQI